MYRWWVYFWQRAKEPSSYISAKMMRAVSAVSNTGRNLNVILISIPFQKFHYGLVNVSDGKCRPQPARLKVSLSQY